MRLALMSFAGSVKSPRTILWMKIRWKGSSDGSVDAGRTDEGPRGGGTIYMKDLVGG